MLIADLYNDLMSFYQAHFSNYNFGNPLFFRNDKELSWRNKLSDPRENDYEIEYTWIVDNLQYSLSMDDIGLFQFYYCTQNDELSKANIVFLPNPDISHQYIRFDFAPLDAKTYFHPEIHFHFGYPSNSMRIAVEKMPYPSNFMLFVFHLLGHQELISFYGSKFVSLSETKITNHFLKFL
jgi:hypothetical protein